MYYEQSCFFAIAAMSQQFILIEIGISKAVPKTGVAMKMHFRKKYLDKVLLSAYGCTMCYYMALDAAYLSMGAYS